MTAKEILACRKRVIAIEGAVGTGKSSLACLFIAAHCAENPGAIWVVIRRTYRMLKDNTLDTWLRWFPDGYAGRIDGEENFHLDCELFGRRATGKIMFRPAERPEDISRFMGGEYAGAFLDEVTGTYREMGLPEDVYTGLDLRLRQQDMTRYHLILAFNPPPPGHWVDQEFPLPPRTSQDTQHFVIPPKENAPNLPEGYYEALFRRLKLKGDWSARFLDGERVPIGKAHCAFDREALMDLLTQASDPVACGLLVRETPTSRFRLRPNPDSPLRVWELPRRPNEDRYVIGADAGGGLPHNDPSAAIVLSRATGNLVAEWHGHLLPREFAGEIAKLGWWYHDAYVVPEVEPSALGRSVCDELENLGYSNLYMQRREQNIGDPPVKRYGLPMGRGNKVRILGIAQGALSDKFGTIPNRELLLELLGFVQHVDGSYSGDDGIHDDRAMAWMLAHAGLEREGKWEPVREPIAPRDVSDWSGTQAADKSWMAE